MSRFPLLLLFLAIPFAAGVAADAPLQQPTAQQAEFFEKQVRPLLAARCLECHGVRKQESGLRLDSRAALLAGGDTGEKVAVPGKPDEGLLLAAVRRTGDVVMPPDEANKLNDEEIAALRHWIEMGMPWPQDAQAAAPVSMSERLVAERSAHWSLQPIGRPRIPDVQNAAWPQGAVDRFVLAKLESAQLTPAQQADRHTLIRRASFDLCGLPPTPAEVEAFVHDKSPDAYERLIDRLLASPRYGARWGRHWLDVARYADTRGYSFGKERRFPYAYTYRDYVIRAFNGDKPYDQFVLEQLAADRLEMDDHDSRLAALGFLTVGRKYNNQHDDIDDQIDVVGRGLLGLTLACARCHDHKYDAVPTEDYYSLYGVFASSYQPDDLPLIGNPQETPGYAEFADKLKKLQRALAEFEQAKRAELVDDARRQVVEYLVRVASSEPEELLQKLPFISLDKGDVKPKLLQQWRVYIGRRARRDDRVFGLWAELLALRDEDFAAKAADIVKRRQADDAQPQNRAVADALAAEPPQSKLDVPRIYGKLLTEAYEAWRKAGGDDSAKAALDEPQRELLAVLLDSGTPTDIPIDDLPNYLVRADRNKQRELEKNIDTHEAHAPGAPPRAMVLYDKDRPVTPRVFLRGNHTRPGAEVPRRFVALLAGEPRSAFSQGSGRLELAQRIVGPDNPLTARVIVNRVWMHHFGEPLVQTPSDFGLRSDPPMHGELLDWLSHRLIESGWSLKALHREILLSATYRQSSVDRPECRKADPENRLLWRQNRKRLEFEPLRDALLTVANRLDEAMEGRPVELFGAAATRRRAVYGLIDRQDLPGELRTFDFAGPDQSNAGRPNTTVPQQALYLMNSEFVTQQAQALAARPELQQGEIETRIHALYMILFGREPTSSEESIAKHFLSGTTGNAGANLTRWEQYVQLLLMTNEFVFID